MCGELGPPSGDLVGRIEPPGPVECPVPPPVGVGFVTRAGTRPGPGLTGTVVGVPPTRCPVPVEAGEPDELGPGSSSRSCRRRRLLRGRGAATRARDRAELVAVELRQLQPRSARSAVERCFACCNRPSVCYGVADAARPGRDAAHDRAHRRDLGGRPRRDRGQRAGVVVADRVAVEHLRCRPGCRCRPS